MRPALKGLVHKLTHSKFQCRASSLKSCWSYVRKLFWLILGWVPESQLSVRNFSRPRSANGCYYFFVSFILLSFHPDRQAVHQTVSISLVNTFGPTPAFPWGPTLPNLSTPNRTHSRPPRALTYPTGSLSTPELSKVVSLQRPAPHTRTSAAVVDGLWSQLGWGYPAHYCAQSNHGPTTTGGYTQPTQETAMEHLALVTEENCTTRPYRIPSTWGHSLKT